MNYRFKDDNQLRRGKNWMSAMGILFIVMAIVIALRNLYFVSTQLSFEFYLDNYTNGDITNEKFVIAMLIIGGFLIYWGRFRKKDNDDEEDEYDDPRRRRPPPPVRREARARAPTRSADPRRLPRASPLR